MGKFKVGDRVRVIKCPYILSDDEMRGTVSSVSAKECRGPILVDLESYGSSLSFCAEELSLASPSFKVGDRVIAKNRGFTTGEHEGVVFKIDDYVGVEYDGWTEGHDAGLGGPDNKWWHDFDEVRLVPKLQVEAGKFYRTRDGRKVGPAKRVTEGRWASGWHWDLGEDSPHADDGTWFYDRTEHPEDLVAEWSDEPVVAASNDNEPKFKVGDRVVGTNCVGLTVNGTITVADYECPAGWPYLVEDDNGAGWCSGAKLSLAPTPAPANRPAIVALIENGQPKPATRPFVHASVEAARTEATRLAGKHKGQIFGVYELVDQAQVERPSYPHEWQRLAADGQKINAIKTLRAVTGLGLKATKDAVEHWLAHDEPYSREYAARAA